MSVFRTLVFVLVVTRISELICRADDGATLQAHEDRVRRAVATGCPQWWLLVRRSQCAIGTLA